MLTKEDWIYKIYLHGEQIDEEKLRGIAFMKFEYAKLLGLAELHEAYVGADYDPVLHTTKVHRGGIYPPCTETKCDCPYHKSIAGSFFTETRPTSFRTEVMSPGDRCGFMLKPSKAGGDFFDYDYCLK